MGTSSRTDPRFQSEYEEALAEFRDSIEERLLQQIDKGGKDGATLRFKARGELPEKYGLRRPAPAPENAGADEVWARLEAEAEVAEAAERQGQAGESADSEEEKG